jgi:hypothetical protein
MRTFTDATGRSWTLAVTVDALKRVRALAGVDLVEAVTGDLWARMIEDPVLLCDAVFALAKPEADARNVSDADFGRAMGGDALGGALLALQEELVGFFPSHQRVRLVARMLEATEAMQRKVKEAAERLRATCGASSGASPASAGATPQA